MTNDPIIEVDALGTSRKLVYETLKMFVEAITSIHNYVIAGTMNCLHNNQNMMNNLIRSELLWEPLQSTKSEISASAPSTGTSNSPISSPVRSSSSVLRFSSASNSARRFSQDSTSSNNSPMGNSRSSFGPSPTSQRMARSGSKKSVRKISRIPYKVLDAPALQVRLMSDICIQTRCA